MPKEGVRFCETLGVRFYETVKVQNYETLHGIRDFKAYYGEHVLPYLRSEFPDLVSYTHFVDFIPSALLPLCAFVSVVVKYF